MLDVLIIAPHPDDAELGLGGSICRFVEEGLRVGILDLTNGEPTPHGTPEIRAAETAAASQVLGVAWRENLGLTNRQLQPTLEARAQLAAVLRRTQPRLMFAPYWVDSHPDHVAATELIEAARFWAKLTKTDLPGQIRIEGEPIQPPRLLYYFCVHLRLAAQPAAVLDISPYWQRKQQSIECYHSQFMVGRWQEPPTLIDRLRDQAAYWGWSIGARYGEPIFSREPLGLTSLRDLL